MTDSRRSRPLNNCEGPQDPQRTNFYDLDRRLEPFDEKLSEERFTGFLQEIQSRWGITLPPTTFVAEESLTHFDPFYFQLEVARNQISKLTALHEAAHVIRYDYDLETLDPESHGPTFARIALDLYAEFLPVNKTTLQSESIDCGIRVAAPGLIVPPDPELGAGFSNAWNAWTGSNSSNIPATLNDFAQRMDDHKEACRSRIGPLRRS